ncbi:hypothetical protein ACQEWB_20175 [Streptomyces sp. CA-249302]|uniref:hypothetical protein n=1 Tax=Streptomyces sp. CA-249302 TaxID=3240058 RepID=UPI003D8F477F
MEAHKVTAVIVTHTDHDFVDLAIKAMADSSAKVYEVRMTRTTPSRPVDIEAVFPELRLHVAKATRLHPRPGSPAPTDSSVGGPLLWPADEPWLVCAASHRKSRGELLENVRQRRRVLEAAWTRLGSDGRPIGPTDEERDELNALNKRGNYAPELGDDEQIPMLPVLQIFQRDIPGLNFPDGSDLLQILWCPFDAHGAEKEIDVRLVWRNSASIHEPLPVAPQLKVVGRAGYVPEPCLVDPEEILEYQAFELLPEDLQESLEEWEDWEDEDAPHYQYDLSVAPGWKAGGFASWHLTGPREMLCDCGAPMRLLVTVDSKEWDNGSLSWRPVEDAGNSAYGLSKPTQVVVGRAGSLRFFVCTLDASHPHKTSEQ